MSDWMLLYLITRLDAIEFLVRIVFGLSFIASLVAVGLCKTSENTEERADMKLLAQFIIAVCVLSGTFRLMIPTKSDMAIIVGGKIALDASRTDTAKEIGGEVLDAIRAQLKKAAQ